MKGNNAFVTLPTGYGKSIILHLLPLYAHYLGLSRSPLVIVVAHLLSLMKDQITKINGRPELGKAVQLTGGSPPTKGEIETGSFIFISPERVC